MATEEFDLGYGGKEMEWMSFDDERDVFHSFSNSFSTWMDPHPSLRHILLFYGAFGGSRFP